jgi:thiamine-phosphate pyrophosphorylase
VLYAITDRRLYGSNEAERRARLLEQVAIWAAHGVQCIQLREKDLSARELVELARAILGVVHNAQGETRLLINGRADVAMAAGAAGVHLPSGEDALTPDEVRAIFAGRARWPYISVACHSLQEVRAAKEQAVDGILFAPVFEKVVYREDSPSQPLPGSGLELLREACRVAGAVPALALGGVTAQNAMLCLRAGAAGVAAIRMMRDSAATWRHLVQ